MDKKAQKEIVDNLLITHQILESDNTKLALNSDVSLATTKGVIARLVLILSNIENKEV